MTLINQRDTDLCLLASTATCINLLLKQKLLDDKKIYDLLLPFHNKIDLTDAITGQKISLPWWFKTADGDYCHPGMVAVAKGLGLEAEMLGGFKSAGDLMPAIKDEAKIALSLDNQFSNDHFGISDLEIGRHVVALLGVEEDKLIVFDPLGSITKLPPGDLDGYLNYRTGGETRAIVFAKYNKQLTNLDQKLILRNIKNGLSMVPKEIVEKVKAWKEKIG